MDVATIIHTLAELFFGGPLMVFIIGTGIICSIAFGFVQIRYFFKSWKNTFAPKAAVANDQHIDMTPLQAFINTLSTNLGNGAIVGTATAIYAGGPGAALWVVLISFFLMALRFAEVYLSIHFGAEAQAAGSIGGPMFYLTKVGYVGSALSVGYAIFIVIFGLSGGNMTQTNSVSEAIVKTWGVNPLVVAFVVLLFTAYVVFGGAARIVKVSDKLVPVKVLVFTVSTLILLGYHYAALGSALALIVQTAFSSAAVAGGVVGFSVQEAMRRGTQRAIFSTESGLGSAGIFFSATGSTDPVNDSISSMLSTFISSCVCFLVGLSIVASGVWANGLNGPALTVSAFETVFGAFGGWIVSFLTVTFGMGVLVSYAYVTREGWLFLTKGRYEKVIMIAYCIAAFFGALVPVKVIWDINDILQAGMLFVNLVGILYLIPVIRRGLAAYKG